MTDFRDYIDYSETYLREAESKAGIARDLGRFLIPATILAWAAVESLVNNMLDDFGSLPEDMFTLHERAFLLEKKIAFVASGLEIGKFDLEGTEYRKLEKKYSF